MRIHLFLMTLLTPVGALAQQRADGEFRFENAHPAYGQGEGPVVCIDEAHHNYHTAEGRYRAFAGLLRGDGYRVQRFQSQFNGETLQACAVVVSANPIGPGNDGDWSYPHDPAFTKDELVALVDWIRGGGSLLLLIDHAPIPGAAGDLGLLLGVGMLDTYARADRSHPVPDRFTRQKGTLLDHPITNGRSPEERVESVATFTGHAFTLSRQFQPLMVYPSGAEAWTDFHATLPDLPEEEEPTFDVEGWAHGGARRWGEGRVVVLGEAAMCTAQQAGENFKMGMNHPEAGQNARFCLNVLHWLTGLMEQESE